MMATAQEKPITLNVPPGARTIHDTFEKGRYYLLLGLSEEMNSIVEDLANRTGDSKADLLNQAIGLYKVVSDAVREEKRVGIAADDQKLETEFVGF
jgi:hypothetical protein